MNLSSLTSLFKKNTKKNLALPESLLIKKLKKIASKNQLLIFENITIYHHSQTFFIPLLILEQTRGIFLFEHKSWAYDDLKNAKAQKANDQEASTNTLAFEKSHEFIKRKFNELTHNDGAPISNYLLMENLNIDQYKHLDSSFHELLPETRVMFNDSDENSIYQKIMNTNTGSSRYDLNQLMSTLLIQYGILENKETIHLASKEQIAFIDSQLVSLETFRGVSGSGKTSTILLKAILEKLKNQKLSIAIIKPTHLACDILRKKLLDTVENAIVEVDPTSIEILTPDLYTNQSSKYDLVICDDAWSCSNEFIDKLRHTKAHKHVILVQTTNNSELPVNLSKNYKNRYKDVFFHQTNVHAKTLQIISTLLVTTEANEILVVGDNLNKIQFKDDLEYYIQDKAILLDSSKSLINQKLDSLLLACYDDICSIEANYVILTNINYPEASKLEYAFNLCKKSVYILYEEESENLKLIRNNFESN